MKLFPSVLLLSLWSRGRNYSTWSLSLDFSEWPRKQTPHMRNNNRFCLIIPSPTSLSISKCNEDKVIVSSLNEKFQWEQFLISISQPLRHNSLFDWTVWCLKLQQYFWVVAKASLTVTQQFHIHTLKPLTGEVINIHSPILKYRCLIVIISFR